MKLTKRKGFNFFRSYYDVYNELNDKDKIQFMDALLDRQFLGKKPNELVGMAKFAYISQTNSIDSQVKGYEDKTGVKLCQSIELEGGSVAPSHGGASPPTLQVEGEEEVEGEEQDVKFSFKKSFIDLGVEEQILKDWMSVRRKKKATDSLTSLNAIKKQIELSGISANECIKICVESDWKGFKSEWLNDKNKIKQANSLDVAAKNAAETIRLINEDPNYK